MIKLILIDGYGVLLSRGYPDTEAVLAKRYGLPVARLHKVIYTKYFNQAAERKITQAEAWQKAVDELKLPMTWLALRDLHMKLLAVNPRTLALVKRLRRKCPVVMLSKNTRSQFQATQKKHTAVWRSVDAAINTWELNLPKASAKTIRLICRRYKVSPKEITYIDDQKNNLTEPKKLGVHTILYTNYPQLKRDLHRIPGLA